MTLLKFVFIIKYCDAAVSSLVQIVGIVVRSLVKDSIGYVFPLKQQATLYV